MSLDLYCRGLQCAFMYALLSYVTFAPAKAFLFMLQIIRVTRPRARHFFLDFYLSVLGKLSLIYPYASVC